MPISSPHPEYEKRVEDWKRVRDSVEGEAALRRNITFYLPVPPGLSVPSPEVLLTNKRVTNTRYGFYAQMAEFPEIVSPTLNGLLGLVHEKDPEIELPADMEYLIHKATPSGVSLSDFWELCTRELLTTGRFVTLGDIVDDKVYLCEYPAESLINWQTLPLRFGGGPYLNILKECKLIPDPEDPYTYIEQTHFRQLSLEEGVYTVRLFEEKEGKPVEIPLDAETSETHIQPMYFGKTFDFIPITVVNALDMGYEYGPIPLLPMTRRALSIFRRSADYNRSLYVKGDPQCVIFGIPQEDIPTEIGGSSIWAFENTEGKAQYLDIDGQGIPLMRQAIADEFARFSDEVGMLLEGSSTGYESGEAIRRRQAMRQVTVKSVIINAAEGLEKALRSVGRMMGKTEDEVNKIRFSPNIDFTEPMMTGQELVNLVTAKNLGAPISEKTIHTLMRRRQVTELEFSEEEKLLKKDREFADEQAEKKAQLERETNQQNAVNTLANSRESSNSGENQQ